MYVHMASSSVNIQRRFNTLRIFFEVFPTFSDTQSITAVGRGLWAKQTERGKTRRDPKRPKPTQQQHTKVHFFYRFTPVLMGKAMGLTGCACRSEID